MNPSREVLDDVSLSADGDASPDVSPRARSDASPRGSNDASPAAADDGSRCTWCRGPIPPGKRVDARTCGKLCRQAAFRCRRLAGVLERGAGPARFGYADPPYPHLARRYYGREATFAGEVDHAALIARLESSGYLGWALATSEKALRDVLPLCPARARVCPWVKPIGVSPGTIGVHNAWEALIVVDGRPKRGGVRNWLRAHPARGWGDLMGRKPLAYCAWLFALLGMEPGDELDDIYPGTGAVGRSWRELSSSSTSDAWRSAANVSRLQGDDASLLEHDDGSADSRNPPPKIRSASARNQ